MESVDKIVNQLFDVSKPVPAIPKITEEKDPRVEAIVSRLFSTL